MVLIRNIFYNKHFGDDFYNFQWNDFELFYDQNDVVNNSQFVNVTLDDIKQALNEKMVILNWSITIKCS